MTVEKRHYLVVKFDLVTMRGRLNDPTSEAEKGRVEGELVLKFFKQNSMAPQLRVLGRSVEEFWERAEDMDEKEAVCAGVPAGGYCPACKGIHRADGTYIPAGGGR